MKPPVSSWNVEPLFMITSPIIANLQHSAAYWVRRYDDDEREKHLHHDPTWRFPDLRGLLDVLGNGS